MAAPFNRPAWAISSDSDDSALMNDVGVKDVLPVWMTTFRGNWDRYIKANFDHEGWRRCNSREQQIAPTYQSKVATVVEEMDQVRVAKRLPRVWSQETLEACLSPYLPVGDGDIRAVIQANVDEPPRMQIPGSPRSEPQGDYIYFRHVRGMVTFERRTTITSRLEPHSPSPDHNYWVSVVQGVREEILMVLSTQKLMGRDILAGSGSIQIWANGSETALTLLAPSALIDPDWVELPYVLAYCKRNRLLFPAKRPGLENSDLSENQGAQTSLRTAFD